MSVKINREQVLEFVRYALDRAVAGVTFQVEPFTDALGRDGLRATATAAGYGERVFYLPETVSGAWDAWQLVPAIVRQFTAGVERKAA